MGSSQAPPTGRRWHLLTYPAARSAGRTALRRQRLVDVALIISALLVGLFMLIPTAEMHSPPALIADICLGLAACGSLVVRRRFPTHVAAFAVVLSAVSAFAAGASLVALFNAAIRVRLRVLAVLTLGELAAVFCFPLLYPGAGDFSYLVQVTIGSLLNLAVVGWGLMVRAQRNYLRTVVARARDLEARQEILAAHAREQERRRIAREMHDALGHRLSLLSVHAGALQLRADLTPEQTRTMAGVIRDTSHDALEDLQEVIGLLRDGSSHGSTLLEPHRGLDELPDLIAEARRAGTQVEFVQNARCETSGSKGHAAATTAYRIVQEGLTNARKHAPHSAVKVVIQQAAPHEIMVSVSTFRDPQSSTDPAIPGTGTGLRGLAERVSLLGGTFSSTTEGNQFVISGRLPWTT
ncbi:sensor histidine kinase [Cumulibacter soli]|uniref:sensor histidine kinase n=1 Tax=Cumulibacter soli TaxID=2546344 RepID=UPI00141A18BC|nr:histidine kinase [Cumulibacter soli]